MLGKPESMGTFSVQLGYGPRFFEIDGVSKDKPEYLTSKWLFSEPYAGGGPVLPDVGLNYSRDMITNEVANDHLMVQLIGETQFATHRAVVETSQLLGEMETKDGLPPISFRTFYTGFNRPDGRGWLGFHDGVSNIDSAGRLKAIQINKHDLGIQDLWTAGGTYLAFLRININLESWRKVPVPMQERIVGREKKSGCPLVDIDPGGKNVFASGCPEYGTQEITQRGNESFRNYEAWNEKITLGLESITRQSHVGRMKQAKQSIFRQGFEFLEPIDCYPFFRCGLNFVSFQGGTDKIYWSIKKGFEKTNFGGPEAKFKEWGKFLDVSATGLFLIPPFDRKENFPGESAFTSETLNTADTNKIPARYI